MPIHEDPVEFDLTTTCPDHGCPLELYDGGDGESGPGFLYQDCPQCLEEQKPKCPECGSKLKVTSRATRNYGGGYDTFEECPNCPYKEVWV